MIITVVHGFSMALADSVPGVSGGTIAFIMGFYERFLTALHHFFGKDNQLRKEAFFYLIKFAIGWIVGLSGSVMILSRVFESNIYFLSSLFLGLTISAIPFIIYEERNVLRGRYRDLIFVLLGIAVVVSLVAFRSNSAEIGAINFQSLNMMQYIYLVISGALAISAMLLPGVSGSTVLLILGVYVPAISSLKEVMSLNFQYLPGICSLAAGILIGIIFASKLIRKGLRRFRPQMVYLIIGLLIGSLYAISMGPTTLEVPREPMDFSSFNIIAFLLGMLVLGGLEFVKKHTENKEKKSLE